MSSKALVIKGVNFATNKVATVSFGEDKHCTGISLSSNALTFTTLAPQTLTATVTPNDTTDAVSWASSDESVATVADGVVTVVGIVLRMRRPLWSYWFVARIRPFDETEERRLSAS